MQDYIEVEVKDSYGRKLIYPVDKQAQKVCMLLGGQKTLTETNIADLKAMGFTIKVKAAEVTL